MSELQAALLAIGSGVIVAVYAFGWWQQRRYRKKFGAAFKASHADALYQESGERPQSQQPPMESMIEDAIGRTAITALDEPCALLELRSDFIIELHLNEASLAAVLDGFWQRKFDFGKPVHVCGMALNSSRWERAIAESHALYTRFRIALQLVDRSGAISAAKLADFRDLVLGVARQIKADTAAPDIHEAHHRAAELDGFCAEVDQMVGINLVPRGERLLLCSQIAQAAALFGMKLESDGAFHLPDMRGWQGTDRRRVTVAQDNDRRMAGRSLFSLVNLDAEPFHHNTLETTSSTGITLLLDLPRVENPALKFDQMMRVAHELAEELQVDLVDDHRVLLSEVGLARIREKIVEVETKMRDNGIAPGSAQARRLFS
ncbi:MAG TPA: cell division protein ZipA C-terminal FtsZ-binding domain-containing protein [Gallionella sp.]|nr:cell division protein ZipA C-terminal FtsZ-binding domain-containing protein [Gallionella sp.]